MTKCYDIILRPKGGSNPPGLLRDIVAQLEKQLAPDCNGKERLVQQRNGAILKDEQVDKHRPIADYAGRRLGFGSQCVTEKEEALEDAVNCIKLLRKLGVEVEMRLVDEAPFNLYGGEMSCDDL
jgi:hypothetical protein